MSLTVYQDCGDGQFRRRSVLLPPGLQVTDYIGNESDRIQVDEEVDGNHITHSLMLRDFVLGPAEQSLLASQGSDVGPVVLAQQTPRATRERGKVGPV